MVNEGNGTVQVCAVITQGTLERSVTVVLRTESRRATGTECSVLPLIRLPLGFIKVSVGLISVLHFVTCIKVHVHNNGGVHPAIL